MGHVIHIAYQGGTHGKFLRYFLDKFCATTPDIKQMPFDADGRSHNQITYSDAFKWYLPAHTRPLTEEPEFKNIDQPHIVITINKEDILYFHRWVHNRTWLEKPPEADTTPDILKRDDLKKMFLDMDNCLFLKFDQKMRQNKPTNSFLFPVNCFWDKTLFYNKVNECVNYFNLSMNNFDDSVYDTFHKQLPFINTRFRVDEIINSIKNNEDINIENIDIVEQAFISAWIEQNNDYINVPFTHHFFKTTKEITEWLKLYPEHYKAMNPNLPKFNNIPNPFYLWKNKK